MLYPSGTPRLNQTEYFQQVRMRPTRTTCCCVLLMWRGNSGQCSDLLPLGFRWTTCLIGDMRFSLLQKQCLTDIGKIASIHINAITGTFSMGKQIVRKTGLKHCQINPHIRRHLWAKLSFSTYWFLHGCYSPQPIIATLNIWKVKSE